MKDIMSQDVNNIITNCIYNQNLMGNDNTAQKHMNNLEKDKISPHLKSINNCKKLFPYYLKNIVIKILIPEGTIIIIEVSLSNKYKNTIHYNI